LCGRDGSKGVRMLVLGYAVDDGLVLKGSSVGDVSDVYLSKKE
jgi:hypothetical protein